MNAKKLETILFIALIVITGGVYLYTVAPTLSFWDCGEFIASAYCLAVPHPPGTPFYILLGRLWLMIFGVIASILPISKEVAWHMNLLGLCFSVGTIALLYKLMLRIIRSFNKNNTEKINIIACFASCLAIAFFYTYWGNAVETEVYAASTLVFLFINYLAFLWYESIRAGEPKHKYIILSFYAIFLSTGIHLIPFLMFIPFYVFILIVERRYLKDILFMLLGIFQVLFFGLTFIFPQSLYVPSLVILAAILFTGIVLPLNNRRKYSNWKFFWISVLAIIAGLSTEFYLPIRAVKLTEMYKNPTANEQYLEGKQIAPRINECNPGENFTAFNNVLHRSQYGPARILPLPRQTQDSTGYSVFAGYFWQMHLFFRYLFWQPVHEGVNRYFRAVILTLFVFFTAWGFIDLFKKDKKIFIFKIAILFMLSFAMVGYLNLKFSPSDPDPKHKPHEVRERDYFFHTGHLYFGLFMGFGFIAFLNWLKKETKNNRLAQIGGTTGILAFSIVPLATNIQVSNRYGDFTPRDYGYNMLITCDNGSILFTNGDNDTFPLWFAQEVLGIKRSVTIANLSLINTNWYIKQLRDWGAPISFSDFIIDRLEPVITRDRRVIYVKDIMIRNIIATNAGISLKNDDYFITQEEFAQRYLKGYKGKVPIYFATTVSEDNYRSFKPYLKLEGLAYRLVGDSSNPMSYVNAVKTRNMFYRTYRYTGIFGPEKQKLLSRILDDFDKRKKEGEFYDFNLHYDDNTRRLYSNYALGLHQLGFAYQEQGLINNTLDAWRFARMFEPYQSYFFDWNIALVFANLGLNDSVEHYLSAIDIQDPSMMIKIAQVYRSIESYENAIEYYRRAMNMNPRLPQPYIGLYTLYLERNDTASAVQIINDWLKMNPSDTSAINLIKALKTQ